MKLLELHAEEATTPEDIKSGAVIEDALQQQSSHQAILAATDNLNSVIAKNEVRIL